MPLFEQTIDLNGIDTETALALAYETMAQLNWEILLAGQDILIGHTPKSWPSKGQQISCSVSYNTLTIISQTVNRDLPNISAVHKNNTIAFLQKFEEVKSYFDEQKLMNNLNAIYALRNVSKRTMEQQQAAYEELDKAMNLTGSNLYVTYAIIGLNIFVFILMILNGAGFFDPNGLVHLRWGSNFAPLTLSGDWWRLITNTFIHFGAIHLTMNMYCLYSIATYLEPMLGKQRYITAYLCAGVIASLFSIWWHTEPTNSAGASGAVFGMYGLFLAFLVTGYIPDSIRNSLLRSIGIFVIFNLAYGMKSGVDNAAHIGGLVSGFVMGYAYVFAVKREKNEQQKSHWLNALIAFVTIAGTALYMYLHPVEAGVRQKLLSELKETTYKDYEAYNQKLKDFDQIHKAALIILADSTLHGQDRIMQINNDLIPKWNEALNIIKTSGMMDISPAAHSKTNKLYKYISLRLDEAELLIQSISQQSLGVSMQLKAVQHKAEALWNEIVQ